MPVLFIIFFIVHIVLCFVASKTAKKKGYSFPIFFVLAFFTSSIIILIITVLLPWKGRSTADNHAKEIYYNQNALPSNPFEEFAATEVKKVNTTWKCSYCGSYNGEKDSRCSGCGAPKDKATK